MAFTTPTNITEELRNRIRDRVLGQAYCQAEAAQQFIGKHCARAKIGPLVVMEVHDYYDNKVTAANIDFRAIKQITDDTVQNAIDLLEDRITRNIGEGDEVTDVDLRIGDYDLIEGVVRGVGFHVEVKMLWNYRYGENAANRVITIYPQFRGNRYGRPLAGKPQQTAKTAAKEAAKAERLAAKEARRAEQLAKFMKAPERLLKAERKDLARYEEDYKGQECYERMIAEPTWMIARLEALTTDQLKEWFEAGCRTGGDIQGKLDFEYFYVKKARKEAAAAA